MLMIGHRIDACALCDSSSTYLVRAVCLNWSPAALSYYFSEFVELTYGSKRIGFWDF